MTKLNLAIAGAAGRMGRELARTIMAADDLALVGGTERPGAAEVGFDIGQLADGRTSGITVSNSVMSAALSAEGWLDFTSPIATLSALDALAETPVKFAIIGTTGLDEAGESRIDDAAKRIAIVRSNNFSLGINLLSALVRQAAQRLGPDWDIEIIEAHHRRKVDAPSGTALSLGEAAAEGRGEALAKLRLAAREGITGARPGGGIGFAVIRGGGIVGEHDVRFVAENEMVTFAHQALDRGIFVRGALAAARWASGKKPGLYSMQDVLDF